MDEFVDNGEGGALHSGAVTPALAVLSAALGVYLVEVQAGGLGRVPDADLLAETRAFEVHRRRLAAADTVLISELERRNLPARLTTRSTSAMLQGLLRLSPSEAAHRVATAHATGPRSTLTGQPLPPLAPALAAARITGTVSAEHTRVILTALNTLPSTTSTENLTAAEQHLTTAAATLRPREVALLGTRIAAHLDPDGTLTTATEHQRRRGFALHPNPDGSYTARGYLTPSCGALLLATLTPRAAPRPAATTTTGDGDNSGGTGSDNSGGWVSGSSVGGSEPDPRSYGQRLHDALEDLAGVAVRRNEHTTSGAPAQVIITMTATQLTTRQGLATTSSGQLLTIPDALNLADETTLHLLTTTETGAILNHHRTKRIATRAQTIALTARDKGCSFPGCDQPPEHCQRHHITPWADGGTTNLDNLTLLCGHHHRQFQTTGWTCHTSNGTPWWTPPPWIDPTRTPQQNHRIQHQ